MIGEQCQWCDGWLFPESNIFGCPQSPNGRHDARAMNQKDISIIVNLPKPYADRLWELGARVNLSPEQWCREALKQLIDLMPNVFIPGKE